jgi:hypothetical protein
VVPELKGSSLHSWEPATSPYPEPCDSTPLHCARAHTQTHACARTYTNVCASVSLRSILISSCHIHLSLLSGHIPSGFPTKTLYTSPISHACHMAHPPHSPWFCLPNDIWWWVQIMKLPIMQFSPFSHYFGPLRSKYSQLAVSEFGCIEQVSVMHFHVSVLKGL